MSKIPQGEWSAIAARYQNGESISTIARSYGCTPPAIHYILKRNRQYPAIAVGQSAREQRAATAGAPIGAIIPDPPPAPLRRVDKAERDPSSGRVRASALATTTSGLPAEESGRKPAPSPPTPGLDRELHSRAETAIEMFRSSFDAALEEGSAGVRARLREAAADLMRVAARTTIVLDRATAGAERSNCIQNYPRSAHARDDFGKPGSV
jgi:transposase-like protein